MKLLTCHTADQELRSLGSTPVLSIKLPEFPHALLSSVEDSKLILVSFLATEVSDWLLLSELSRRPSAV